MNSSELRDLYTEAVKIARAERKMRLFVFRGDPIKQAAKIAEIDRLLEILVLLKDVAKLSVDADYEQPSLLDVPRKAEYN